MCWCGSTVTVVWGFWGLAQVTETLNFSMACVPALGSEILVFLA